MAWQGDNKKHSTQTQHTNIATSRLNSLRADSGYIGVQTGYNTVRTGYTGMRTGYNGMHGARGCIHPARGCSPLNRTLYFYRAPDI